MLVLLLALLTHILAATKSYHTLLNQIWFFSDTNSTVSSDWMPVSLPHNGVSNTNISNCSWYRTIFVLDFDPLTANVILDVGAAGSVLDIYVNEIWVAQHRNAFSRFRADFTLQAAQSSKFRLCSVLLRVDNGDTIDTLPQNSKFPVFGGIFRDIGYWIVPKHTPLLSLFDLGSPGVRFQQTNSLSQSRLTKASFVVIIHVECFGNLTATSGDTFELNLKVLDGLTEVAAISRSFSIHPSCLLPTTFKIPLSFRDPHLWDGRVDPFLYTSTVDLVYEGSKVDSFFTKLGVRSFHIDSKQGFFLNGRPYSLHGVNMHQDWAILGWAIKPTHTNQNFDALNELNATALRCAHYQHSEYTYSLADQHGLIIWAEIPVSRSVSPNVYLNAGIQLRELIFQSGNHPSILFWSISHDPDVNSFNPYPLLWILRNLVKTEDPYRLSVMALSDTTPLTNSIVSLVDAVTVNTYHGWTTPSPGTIGTYLDDQHAKSPSIRFGVSEYGAGAVISRHSETPTRQDHTEEYQSYLHEKIYPQLQLRKYIWWKTAWNLADSATANSSGNKLGVDDMGLMTFDRTIRKDAFYWYKAQWNTTPMIHILSSRFKYRAKTVDVRMYVVSVKMVQLFVNGVGVAEQETHGDLVVHFEQIRLVEGLNRVVAKSSDGTLVSNSVAWYYFRDDLVLMNDNET